MQRILVLGAGFAGLWSAVAAARRLDELGADDVEVLVVNRTASHSIRVRNYEVDLDATLVPLADVLDPIRVKHVIAEVTDINVVERKIACRMDDALQVLAYDRLVFALGSRLARPAIPGLETHAFDIDTFEAATRLNEHIGSFPSRPASTGQFNVLVVGAGLTGVEVATGDVRQIAYRHRKGVTFRPGSTAACDSRRPSSMDRIRHGGRAASDRRGSRKPWCGNTPRHFCGLHRRGRRDPCDRRANPGSHRGLVRRHASPSIDGALSGRARPAWPPARRCPSQDQGHADRVRRRGCRLAADRWHARFRHVVPARASNGALRWLQCRQRSFGRADAAAANRLVCHMPRSRSLGSRLYGRLGPPCCGNGRGSQTHQGDHQSPAHLSATLTQQARNSRCSGASRAGSAVPAPLTHALFPTIRRTYNFYARPHSLQAARSMRPCVLSPCQSYQNVSRETLWYDSGVDFAIKITRLKISGERITKLRA
jgi:Pyridine nucleotide-disulphide oxidoreductase